MMLVFNVASRMIYITQMNFGFSDFDIYLIEGNLSLVIYLTRCNFLL